MSKQIKVATILYPLTIGKHIDNNSGRVYIDEKMFIEVLDYIKGKKVYREVIRYLKQGFNIVGYDLNYTRINDNQSNQRDINQVYITSFYLKKPNKLIKTLTKKKQYHPRRKTTWGIIKKEVAHYGI